MSIDFKIEAEDVSFAVATAKILGADSQGAARPSIYPASAISTAIHAQAATLTNKTLSFGSNTVSATMAELDAAISDGNRLSPMFYAALLEANTAAQNKTALDAAITLAAVDGGVVMIPVGTFDCNAPAEITANGVTIRGQGMSNGSGTTIQPGSATADWIVFSGQHSGIENICISGGTLKHTAGYAVKFSTNSFQCFARDLRIDYMYNGIYVTDSNALHMSHIVLRYMIGALGIYITGATRTDDVKVDRLNCDNPYPQSYGTVKSWATSTSYVLNDIVSVNGSIWQCSTAGQSNSVGTGPSAIPGTTGATVFTTATTDNAAAWKWVCSSSLAWFCIDSRAYSISLDNAALINGNNGVYIIDAANTGSSYPTWFNAHSLEVDHPYSHCVDASKGSGVYLVDGWFGSSLTGRGVNIGASHLGEVFVGAGTRIYGNWLDGILLNAGPKGNIISGCHIGLNSQIGSGTNHGIAVGANAVNFSITGNIIGRVSGSSGQQGYGVLINAGTSNYYNILGNITEGNATGGISDGGSGTTKAVTTSLSGGALPTTTSSVGTGTKTISNAADSSTNFGKYLTLTIGATTIYVPCGTVAPT